MQLRIFSGPNGNTQRGSRMNQSIPVPRCSVGNGWPKTAMACASHKEFLDRRAQRSQSFLVRCFTAMRCQESRLRRVAMSKNKRRIPFVGRGSRGMDVNGGEYLRPFSRESASPMSVSLGPSVQKLFVPFCFPTLNRGEPVAIFKKIDRNSLF
jgi:hypothetical protein